MALTKFNNSRNQLNCDSNRDELIAWAQTIPLDELWDEIRRITGIADLEFKHRLPTAGPVRIFFESQDLEDRVGFLKHMFATCRIENLSSEVVVREKDGAPVKIWWGTVCFNYTNHQGSHHSTTFMGFRYMEGEGWTFADYSSDI